MLKHEVHYINKLKKEINKIKDMKALYTDPLTDCDGVPDLLVLNKETQYYMHVEVKKHGEDLRPNQVQWCKKYTDFIMIAEIQEDGKAWKLYTYDHIRGKEDVFRESNTTMELKKIAWEVTP